MIDLPTPFAMDASERHNPVWVRLKAHLNDMLAKKRERNDAPLGQFETAALRGEIKLLREIIRLGDEPPPLVE